MAFDNDFGSGSMGRVLSPGSIRSPEEQMKASITISLFVSLVSYTTKWWIRDKQSNNNTSLTYLDSTTIGRIILDGGKVHPAVRRVPRGGKGFRDLLETACVHMTLMAKDDCKYTSVNAETQSKLRRTYPRKLTVNIFFIPKQFDIIIARSSSFLEIFFGHNQNMSQTMRIAFLIQISLQSYVTTVPANEMSRQTMYTEFLRIQPIPLNNDMRCLYTELDAISMAVECNRPRGTVRSEQSSDEALSVISSIHRWLLCFL
ncbi:hypothetical protein MAR_008859 [Mya arenaria]|uniref:Uncharacterized protein n=1 Tax=Mya arenaria TaxID=6604 RepID=A0ABY7E047_MYAAR|nr:hypothetical protein MAR_008859 [Mya arenaria]